MNIRDCLERLCGVPVPLTEPSILRTREDYEGCRWIETGRAKPAWSELEAVWPEIETELERGQVLRNLEASDADMARIIEDLIDAGGDPALLPQAVLDKIASRKALRTRLAELSE